MFSFFNSNVYSQSESFYDLNIKSIEGDNISFNSFKGKNVLIVNVASYCGFTRQYKALEQLYVKYKNGNNNYYYRVFSRIYFGLFFNILFNKVQKK